MNCGASVRRTQDGVLVDVVWDTGTSSGAAKGGPGVSPEALSDEVRRYALFSIAIFVIHANLCTSIGKHLAPMRKFDIRRHMYEIMCQFMQTF